MQKLKTQHVRRHWETLSDEELLAADLIIDDPESLENLVFEVPAGDEEPYVEFKYDLRKSGRDEEFTCVHGHHKHLAGFVMRKGKARFMVGWMCGKSIYEEDFDQYTADFNTAVNRQQTLRKRREIEKETGPFMAWLEYVLQSDVFKLYESVRRQLDQRLPWVWDNVPRIGFLGESRNGVTVPATLFLKATDPRAEFAKVVAEMSALAMTLIGKEELGEKSVEDIKRALGLFIRRIEKVFDELKEVEDFFQPAVLDLVCKLANDYDNPKKRKYSAGLQSLTCKRARDKSTVQMPNNYRLPNRSGLEALKKSLKSL
jgi:hypothetical protein